MQQQKGKTTSKSSRSSSYIYIYSE
uniref:Uncharacterized protein n=1 Tax=Rhizophora mucronata TaxID=61149 RepID=A0A2P2Q297_RHIMU